MRVFNKFNKLKWFDLSEFLKFTGGDLLFQIISIVCEILILKLIPIEELGIWQFCLLIQGYVIISRMGIINSFNREYVVEKSVGNDIKAQKYLETTAFHMISGIVLQGLVFAGISIYYFYTKQWLISFASLVMIIYTWLDALSNFEEAKLRVQLKFNVIGRLKLFASAILLITLILPYYFSFYGLMVRVILNLLFVFVFYRSQSESEYKIALHKDHWIQLFKDGWKFWLVSYLRSFNKTLPRLFVLSYGGIALLGLYAPVNWILTGFTLLTGSLNTYLYPVLIQQYSKGNIDLPKLTLFINMIIFLCAIPIVIVAYFFLPFFVNELLPQYNASVPAMQIILVASLLDVIVVSISYWYASNNWKMLFVFSVMNITISVSVYSFTCLEKVNLLERISEGVVFTSLFAAVFIVFNLINNKSHKLNYEETLDNKISI